MSQQLLQTKLNRMPWLAGELLRQASERQAEVHHANILELAVAACVSDCRYSLW